MTEIRLGDASQKIGSGATPRGGKEVYLSSGKTAFIRSQNIYNNRFEKTGVVYLTDEQANDLSNVEVLPNDVLLNITGDSVARACQVPSKILPARVNQHVAIIRTIPQKLDSRFLSYFLVSPVMQSRMLSMASAGATRQALTKGMIENFRIPQFELEKQKAIAAILGALDDKIELNRRTNATLETMARALFKSWFVDFDPVRAKSEGRQPFGMDAETAALFPFRLTPSTLGDIPEGWTVGTIKELCARVESGGTPSRSEPAYWQDGNVPWLTSGEVRQKIVLDTKEKISLKGLEGSNAKLWPALSTVVAMYGATAGQVTLLGNQMAANQACCALIPATDAHSFVYLKTSQSVSEYEGQATGSAQQNLNQTIVANLQTIIPVRNILAAFQGIVAGHLFTMIQNTKESDSLASMRDYLLPKLISGDIRISDAEKFVEAA